MQQVAKEGRFRAKIYQYRPDLSGSSEATGLWMSCLLLKEQGPLGWTDIKDGVYCAEGTVWFIKANGDKREDVIENLRLATGWDGTMEQLLGETETPWVPLDVEITVKKEVYKEQERYKIAFVNAITEGPGAVPVGKTTAEKLKERFNRKNEEAPW
ncbi:hypothetical protein [Nitrospira sp. BLG_1]|uniref:hypothetical protein n=1 Tax=Nitrospira sp. BLG_1 TaxID=3395883 RepID=UPI0039BCDACA